MLNPRVGPITHNNQ